MSYLVVIGGKPVAVNSIDHTRVEELLAAWPTHSPLTLELPMPVCPNEGFTSAPRPKHPPKPPRNPYLEQLRR